MKKAAIDIGTNTVLLLVAEAGGEKIRVIEERQKIPRLGRRVDRNKTLHQNSIERVIKVLKEYKFYLDEHYSEITSPIVTATSAVRDASNKKEFMEAVLERTGWKVRLLSGEEEAEYTYKGALSVLEPNQAVRTAVLDIGGGSTEIAIGKANKLQHAVSLDIGSVRFSERFLLSDPPTSEQVDKAREVIKNELNGIGQHVEFESLVGVAGTVTSIAAIQLKLRRYKADELNGQRLTREEIGVFLEKFSRMSSSEIEVHHPVFLKGRGDVILGGLLILQEFMKKTQMTHLVVSTGGIRHGVLL